jgi:CBS domain-containing protein
MRADQIMTRNLITISPKAGVADAIAKMLEFRIGGLPVVDSAGALVGIVTEGDFLRRTEIGTERKRPRWLQFFTTSKREASEFIHAHGRTVDAVMTRDVFAVREDCPLEDIVELMERKNIHRLPVVRNGGLVGLVTRSNLLQAISRVARDIPNPATGDDQIRELVTHALVGQDWRPAGLQITVRDGVVHLHGFVVDESSRQASIIAAQDIAGVKEVVDHLCFVNNYSGFYEETPDKAKVAG